MRRIPHQFGWRLPLILCGLLCLSVACSGVFEEVSPPEKEPVLLVLVPDFVRVGDDTVREVGAFLDVDPNGTFVTDIDMGPGIEVVGYSSVVNQGCESVQTPVEFLDKPHFRICISLLVEPQARVGEQPVSVEVRTGGEPRRGSASFFVLREL